MMEVKQFVQVALDVACAEMADGSDYEPCAYFLLPKTDKRNHAIHLLIIDPNFMAPGFKDKLRAILLAHLEEHRAIFGVLVSDAWGAEVALPRGTTPEQARAALPDHIADYAGRTEFLMASVFGEGLAPLIVKWPYTRREGKPVFKPEDLKFEEEGVKVTGRFAIDLRHGKKPA